MRKETKAKRALTGIEAYLAKSGVQLDVVKEVIEKAPTHRDEIHLQAEAVLLYLERPARFIMKPCKLCGEHFGTNYRAVAYCSDAHRAKALTSQTGIPWNPHKTPQERWGGEAPLIIPPSAVNKLRQFAEQLLAQLPAADDSQILEARVELGVAEVTHPQIDVSHTIPETLPPQLIGLSLPALTFPDLI